VGGKLFLGVFSTFMIKNDQKKAFKVA